MKLPLIKSLLWVPLSPFVCLFLLVGMTGSVWGQDFDDYQPLKSSGEIPENLLRKASDKFAEESDIIGEGRSKKDKKTSDRFLLESSFALDNMMLSGKVLFNDPVGDYLNTIKDYLLRDNPGARDSIQVYAVRSPDVNAFCTNNGVVLVHFGLLNKVKNEAQIAAILSHEFQHFLEQHPLNVFEESERLRSGIRPGFENYNNFLLEKNRYSREKETEADLKGLELYLNSAYAPSEQIAVFDVLRYAQHPYEEVAWTPDYFKRGDMVFDAELLLDTVQAIDVEEEYDDSKMSHPNIATRRGDVMERLEAVGDSAALEEGVRFIFGEERFQEIQKRSRFEVAHLYLEQRRYERALQQAMLLQREEPGSFYLEKIIAQSLYGLAKYKNARQFYTVHADYENIEGESQNVFYFMEELERVELHTLALSYCYGLANRGNDAELTAIVDDLVLEFHKKHEKYLPEIESGEVDLTDSASFVIPAFVYLKDQFGFTEAWEKGAEEWEETRSGKKPVAEKEEEGDFYGNSSKRAQERKDLETELEEEEWVSPRQRRKERLRGSALGADKVVFVTPIFKEYHTRKKRKVRYLDAELKAENYNATIDEMGDLLGLKTEVLDFHRLVPAEVDRFNDIILMREWISDLINRETEVEMVSIYQDDVKYLPEKYGTSKLALSGYLSLKTGLSPTQKLTAVVLSPLLIPIPYYIYKAIRPSYNSLYFNFVFDLIEGESQMLELREIKLKDSSPLLRSSLYYSLSQMKAKP